METEFIMVVRCSENLQESQRLGPGGHMSGNSIQTALLRCSSLAEVSWPLGTDPADAVHRTQLLCPWALLALRSGSSRCPYPPPSSPGKESVWALLPRLPSSKSMPCLHASDGLRVAYILSFKQGWELVSGLYPGKRDSKRGSIHKHR